MTREQTSGTFPRYLLVGVGMSLLDLLLFSLLAVGAGVPEVLSNVVSTVITVCVSFLINRSFVFRAHRQSVTARAILLSFASFAGVTLVTGLVIQSAVIWGVVQLTHAVAPGLEYALVAPAAKIVAMGVGAICNYLGYRLVFKER